MLLDVCVCVNELLWLCPLSPPLRRRRRFDECITQCTEQLAVNPLDRAVWFIKLKALTNRAFVDDMDMEEEGVAEILMDDNAMQKAPR